MEQALAIVVNSPDSMGEALEKVEAALEAEPAELTGLDTSALERARTALEAGDAHGAEDALVEALGSDPHPEAGEGSPVPVTGAGEAEISETTTTSLAASESAEPLTPAAEAVAPGVTGGEEEEESGGLLSTPTFRHGLTERLEVDPRSPAAGPLVAAVVLLGAGTLLLRRRVGLG